MKKFFSGLLVGAMLFTLVPSFAEDILNVVESTFPIHVNGQAKDISAYNINNATYVNITDLDKALGNINVAFDNKKNIMEIKTQEYLNNTQNENTTDTKYKGFDAKIYDGVTYVKYDFYRDLSINLPEENSFISIGPEREKIKNPEYKKHNYYDIENNLMHSDDSIPKVLKEYKFYSIKFGVKTTNRRFTSKIYTSKIDTSNPSLYKNEDIHGYIHHKFVDEILEKIVKIKDGTIYDEIDKK